MTAPNHSDSQEGNLDKVLRIINRLARKSAESDYIYRGEPRLYKKVSSSLYRKLHRQFQGNIDVSEIPVEVIQAGILGEAEKFTVFNSESEQSEISILSQLQHYGGETNLIDFTTDYLTALFFACDGANNKNGRVIFLSKSGDMSNHIIWPSNPENRVIAQKSVFVRPPKGYIEPDGTIFVPHKLKQPILDYLRIWHSISTESIYNDFHGFIRVQALHQQAYSKLYIGLTFHKNGYYKKAIDNYTEALTLNPQMADAYIYRGTVYADQGKYVLAKKDFDQAIKLNPKYAAAYINRGNVHVSNGEYDSAIQNYNNAITLDPDDAVIYHGRGNAYSSKGDFEQAVKDYSIALDLDPDDVDAYFNRGIAWLCLSEWVAAKSDLTIARDMGLDISVYFKDKYNNTAEFELRYGVSLPDKIKEMLE